MQRRALVVVVGVWAAIAGCAQVWGIGDVPVPIDATTSDSAPETQAAEAAVADTLVPDASHTDAPSIDGTLADTSTRDTSVDTSAVDAPLADAAPPEAAVDAGCPTDPCVMATGLNNPFSMTSDGNNVYWTELGTAFGSKDGTVKSCPVSGCGAGPTVIASALLNPRGIAVDGTNVYFATATRNVVQGAIWSCPLAGCQGALPTMLATAGIPDGVAVDSNYVYWVDSDFSTVSRVAKVGTAPVDVLYDAATQAISSPEYCAVDGTGVYVTDVSQRIVRIPLAGGEPTVIFRGSGSGYYSPLALDPANLYFAIDAQIDRASKSSMDGGPAIATGFAQVLSLAIDGNAGEIYWADYGTGTANDGTVGKVGIDGGAFFLGSQLATPAAVTVSGNHAFWISQGANVNGSITDPNSGMLTRLVK
jgi:hypothetical protein